MQLNIYLLKIDQLLRATENLFKFNLNNGLIAYSF